MASELLFVPVKDIRDNPVALRAVNRESEEYQGIVDSIRAKGVLNPINLRRKADKETGIEYYELIDGLHRLSATRDAGLDTIPAQILTMADAEVLEAQIIGNAQRVETKPVEYSNQLRRILAIHPLMTEVELAVKLGKSSSWIQNRLGLTKISNPVLKELIDDGKIPLSNAYALARLPEGEQADYAERAQTEDPQVFTGAVNNRLKEIKEAKRQGREAAPAEFVATPHLQKISAIKEALDDSKIVADMLKAVPVDTKEDAFRLALQWTLHLDPLSCEAGRAKWQAQQDEKAEAAKRRAEERAAKKAEEAKAAAEEAAAAAE